MVEAAIDHARKMGFRRVYIPSDMLGFYEAYGFEKINTPVTTGEKQTLFLPETFKKGEARCLSVFCLRFF